MGVPLPIDDLRFARRLYHYADKFKDYSPKWPRVKEAMEREFPEYNFKPNTYTSLNVRLRTRYGLMPASASYDYIERRPIEELLGDAPLEEEVIEEPEIRQSSPAPQPQPLGTIAEEIQKGIEQIHTQQTKREYTKALQERSRTEIICDAIREGMKALPPFAGPAPYIQVHNDSRSYDAILMFSDLQIGQYTRADETGGLVEYSTEIFYERMENLERQLIRRITELRKAYTIRTLHVAGLGDIVENETIFEGQKSQIDANVMDQFLNGGRVIADFLYRLAEQLFVEIFFTGVAGNHGRIGSKGEANLFTNWDFLLYEFLKARLSNQSRIHIDVPRSWWTIKRIRNSRFLMTHGDNVKAWNSIPYYGFDRADARQTMLMQSKGLQYDYWLTAHHHNPASIDRPFGERIINGAFPGGSVFSTHQLNTASQPAQTLLFVGDKRVEWQEKLRIAEVE